MIPMCNIIHHTRMDTIIQKKLHLSPKKANEWDFTVERNVTDFLIQTLSFPKAKSSWSPFLCKPLVHLHLNDARVYINIQIHSWKKGEECFDLMSQIHLNRPNPPSSPSVTCSSLWLVPTSPYKIRQKLWQLQWHCIREFKIQERTINQSLSFSSDQQTQMR